MLLRFLAGCLVLGSLPAAGKGLLVSPSRLSVTVAAGSSATETLVLTPTTAESTRVNVSIETFGLDADGKPWRGPGSESPRSLTSLVEVAPKTLVLEAGKAMSVRVKLTPPPSGTGSYWAAIALEVEPVTTTGSGEEPMDVVTRLVVPAFCTVAGGPAPRLAVEDIVARKTGEGAVELTATIENTGIEVVRAQVFLTLEEPGAGGAVEVGTAELAALTFLPGFPRRIRTTIKCPASSRGPLSAGVMIPYGERLAEARARVAF